MQRTVYIELWDKEKNMFPRMECFYISSIISSFKLKRIAKEATYIMYAELLIGREVWKKQQTSMTAFGIFRAAFRSYSASTRKIKWQKYTTAGIR
jgi:hypothetical protein